ncbi:MAG: DUF2092 domain-containing protein [Beijerinckiaceae bacterium]
MRITGRSLFAGLLVGCAIASAAPAAAQNAPAAPPVDKRPIGIQEPALALIKGMSDKLAKAKSMSFTVRRAFDELGAADQPLFYFVGSNVTIARPNRLKIVTTGDGPPSEVWFDGKELAVFMPKENMVAVMSAPADLDGALEAAYVKGGFYLPFVDFIVADPYKSITEKLTTAFVVGKSNQVGGTITDVVAIANPNFQAQIWIGANDRLPRLAIINPARTNEKPRSIIEFSNWKIDRVAASESFRSDKAAKARKIEFRAPKGSLQGAK